MKFFLCLILLGIILSPLTIVSQDMGADISRSLPETIIENIESAPAWLLRNLGRQAREDLELEQSFMLLNRSLEKDPNNPETLTEMALSYSASGDTLQALAYLQQALERRDLLSSSDLEYSILYRLSEIYHESERYRDYENILLEIVAEDTQFVSEESFELNLRRSILESYRSSPPRGTDTSLDRTIQLYRLEDGFSLRAHIELGRFYVESGRYDEAERHLLFAVIKIYSTLIASIRSEDPLYAFNGSGSLFALVSDREVYLDYLRESNLDTALYYLGVASYGNSPERSFVYRAVWNTLLLLPIASQYEDRVQRQLVRPFQEELKYGDL